MQLSDGFSGHYAGLKFQVSEQPLSQHQDPANSEWEITRYLVPMLHYVNRNTGESRYAVPVHEGSAFYLLWESWDDTVRQSGRIGT